MDIAHQCTNMDFPFSFLFFSFLLLNYIRGGLNISFRRLFVYVTTSQM